MVVGERAKRRREMSAIFPSYLDPLTNDRRFRHVLRNHIQSGLRSYEDTNETSEGWFADRIYPNDVRSGSAPTGKNWFALAREPGTYALIGDIGEIRGVAGALESAATWLVAGYGDATASSTQEELEAKRVEATFDQFIEEARDEIFRDGIDTNLSVGVDLLVRRFPRSTMAILPKVLERRDVGQLLVGHVIRALGKATDERTVGARVNLIAQYLSHANPYVRDAAAIALSYIGDKQAVQYIKAAIEAEQNRSLRDDMESALATFDD